MSLRYLLRNLFNCRCFDHPPPTLPNRLERTSSFVFRRVNIFVTSLLLRPWTDTVAQKQYRTDLPLGSKYTLKSMQPNTNRGRSTGKHVYLGTIDTSPYLSMTGTSPFLTMNPPGPFSLSMPPWAAQRSSISRRALDFFLPCLILSFSKKT